MMKLVILINLIVLMAADDSSHEYLANQCADYPEDWRIAACAANLKSRALITKTTFNNYLELAKAKGGVQTEYYSVGLTVGMSNRLVVGKINDPVFEKNYGIDYNPAALYGKPMWVDMGHEHEKMTILYLTNEIPDIPEWDGSKMNRLQHKGVGEITALYKAPEQGPVTTKEKENCSKLTKWMHENIQTGIKGITIAVGPDMWCPVLRDGLASMVVAEMHSLKHLNENGEITTRWTVKRAIWKDGSFGDTKAFEAVFL
nr:VP2 [Jingmenvirus sp.]